MTRTMTEMQRSALLEAGNIGSGHAAIALSQLMGKKIMIAIPSIRVLETDQLDHLTGKEGRIFVHVSLMVLGDVTGAIVFTLDEQKAFLLCDIVMGQEKDTTRMLGGLESSALKEVGSIIAASYLNAISEMTGLSLIVSTPGCSIGSIKTLGDALRKQKAGSGKVLCIKTEFVEAATRIEGYLVFMPAEDAIEKIFSALCV